MLCIKALLILHNQFIFPHFYRLYEYMYIYICLYMDGYFSLNNFILGLIITVTYMYMKDKHSCKIDEIDMFNKTYIKTIL